MSEPAGSSEPADPLRPTYQRLPDYVREMLEKPLRNIRATHPEAVTMLRQRLSILENARQFGGSVKLESRIARTRALLDHALAIQATPSTVEMLGEIQIRDDAEAGQVVITFPAPLTPEMVKLLRCSGFVPKAGRMACRLRKISRGRNVALDDPAALCGRCFPWSEREEGCKYQFFLVRPPNVVSGEIGSSVSFLDISE